MKVWIEKAKLKDAKEIVEKLWVPLMRYHEKLDKYYKTDKKSKQTYMRFLKKKIRSNRSMVLVAKVDDKIIGLVRGEMDKRPPVYKIKKIGRMTDMFVSSKYRRKGIGELLVKEIIKWFKGKGLRNFELSAYYKNKTGVNFWKKLGFEEHEIKMKSKSIKV